MIEVSEKQSIGDLFSRFSDEVKTLFRDEFEMMRLEISEKAARTGKHVGLIAAGGYLVLAGGLILLGAVIWLLALVMQVWIASLIVGVIVTAAGIYMIKQNLKILKRIDLKPGRSIESLRAMKEEGKWLKK